MPCNPQTLLDDAACFVALPAQLQGAATLQLWCDYGGGGPSTSAILAEDGTDLLAEDGSTIDTE